MWMNTKSLYISFVCLHHTMCVKRKKKKQKLEFSVIFAFFVCVSSHWVCGTWTAKKNFLCSSASFSTRNFCMWHERSKATKKRSFIYVYIHTYTHKFHSGGKKHEKINKRRSDKSKKRKEKRLTSSERQ